MDYRLFLLAAASGLTAFCQRLPEPAYVQVVAVSEFGSRADFRIDSITQIQRDGKTNEAPMWQTFGSSDFKTPHFVRLMVGETYDIQVSTKTKFSYTRRIMIFSPREFVVLPVQVVMGDFMTSWLNYSLKIPPKLCSRLESDLWLELAFADQSGIARRVQVDSCIAQVGRLNGAPNYSVTLYDGLVVRAVGSLYVSQGKTSLRLSAVQPIDE